MSKLNEQQDWKLGSVRATFSIVEILTIAFAVLFFLSMCGVMYVLENDPCFMYTEITGRPCE